LDSIIRVLNIMPSYACNLSCPHCNVSALRGSTQLSAEQLRSTLQVIRDTQPEPSPRSFEVEYLVEWYGGEISLLSPEYLLELIEVVQEVLGKARHSFVSNLTAVSDNWLQFAKANTSHICTSFEGLRFSAASELGQQWLKNLHHFLEADMAVDCIAVLSHALTPDDMRFLASFPFRYISTPSLLLPETMPKTRQAALLELVLTPTQYFERLTQFRQLLGTRWTSPADGVLTLGNVVHIFPDGVIGLPSPSVLDYPYEKTAVFYQPGQTTTTEFVASRQKYLCDQLRACARRCTKMNECIAEFRYPTLCVTGQQE
jgi:hypothetical protein